MTPLRRALTLLTTALLLWASRAPASSGPPADEALKVTEVPKELRETLKLDPFYQKYTHFKSFPILSSAKVSDAGLLEARDIVAHMLADRDDILQALLKKKARVVVMAPTEMTTDVPEQKNMKPKDYWDKRARGLGGKITSCGEENLLNLKGDRYAKENILVHEFAHCIHEQGLRSVDPKFDGKLKATYERAMDKGLWKKTYAATNYKEYWAEGVQSYFDCNNPPNAVHNDINTREKLAKYDPDLFELIDEVFKQSKWRYVRYDVRHKKQEPQPVPKGLRVFVCGHSLHWYIPSPLGELAEAAGIKGHQLVGTQSLGASKTLQHWNLPEEKNKAKQALKKGDVDVFTMSPIQFPDQGIENFIDLGLKHNPDMRFTVQISWGGWDIDNQDFPKGATFKVDREKTPEQLKKLYERNIKAAEAQADEINKKVGKKVLCLVPSAQAVVALRIKIYNKEMPGLKTQAELFKDPLCHPAPPLEVLNTYLHFAVIYGVSPVSLPMPSVLKKAKKEAWDEPFNRSLQELAWETVTSYPYSGVTAPKAK
jgi:alpha-glucosidase